MGGGGGEGDGLDPHPVLPPNGRTRLGKGNSRLARGRLDINLYGCVSFELKIELKVKYFSGKVSFYKPL